MADRRVAKRSRTARMKDNQHRFAEHMYSRRAHLPSPSAFRPPPQPKAPTDFERLIDNDPASQLGADTARLTDDEWFAVQRIARRNEITVDTFTDLALPECFYHYMRTPKERARWLAKLPWRGEFLTALTAVLHGISDLSSSSEEDDDGSSTSSSDEAGAGAGASAAAPSRRR